MTPAVPASSPRRASRRIAPGAAALGLAVLLAVGTATLGHAQSAASIERPGATAPAPVAEQGVRWRDLKPAQQDVLRPLERDWSTIGPVHKQKWIELSGNFAKRSPDEQARIQGRMADWARLTAEERGQARLNFQEAKSLEPNDRKARWEAYQALSPEQKQRLAARAVHPVPSPASGLRPVRAESGGVREPQPKSNIVPATPVASPKVIGPGVVQARPGATTTLITKRPTPPSHQHTGLPKIAATPEFVNKATLLPRRGPQGAATRSAAAPASGTAVPQ